MDIHNKYCDGMFKNQFEHQSNLLSDELWKHEILKTNEH